MMFLFFIKGHSDYNFSDEKSAKKLLQQNSRLFEESENVNGEDNYLFYVTLACEDEQQQVHKVILQN